PENGIGTFPRAIAHAQSMGRFHRSSLREAAMRRAIVVITMLLTSGSVIAQDTGKPLTPADVATKIDQQVTVEFEVKSTGGERNRYLNSASDFSAANNFTIFIPQAAMPKFAAAKIEKPDEHFYGKVIQVTGAVALARGKPQIVVTDPAQIKIIQEKSG